MPHKEQFGSSMYEETSFGTPAEAGSWSFRIQNGTRFVQLLYISLHFNKKSSHFRGTDIYRNRETVPKDFCFDGVDRLRYL